MRSGCTPGPWKAHQTAGGEWWVMAPDETDHDFRDDSEPIFESSGVAPDFEHDAKLMAAAPELFDALQDLISCAETYPEFTEPGHDFWLSLKQAESALEEAEGRQS